MTWKEFELHVAGLLRRDGCTDVEVYGGHGGDRGVDITARTADGRSVAVQCKNFAPFRHVLSGEMQKFLGASKVLHQADVALYVATCAFTREALGHRRPGRRHSRPQGPSGGLERGGPAPGPALVTELLRATQSSRLVHRAL
ncbi:restriction endonuclease [Streptomyces sp. NBC_01546]